MMVNSKGACVGVLSEIGKLHPHIPVQVSAFSAPERSARQTYRAGVGVAGRQLSRERQSRFKNSTLASLCSL